MMRQTEWSMIVGAFVLFPRHESPVLVVTRAPWIVSCGRLCPVGFVWEEKSGRHERGEDVWALGFLSELGCLGLAGS